METPYFHYIYFQWYVSNSMPLFLLINIKYFDSLVLVIIFAILIVKYMKYGKEKNGKCENVIPIRGGLCVNELPILHR